MQREETTFIKNNDTIRKLSEGNLLSYFILKRIKMKYINFPYILMLMEDMNIRGRQIWFGFYYCRYNLNTFVCNIAAIKKEKDFIDAINILSVLKNEDNKAIEKGAINIRRKKNNSQSLFFSEQEKNNLMQIYNEKYCKKEESNLENEKELEN